MSPEQVASRVKNKDWDVLETPGAIGPDAAPTLISLLSDKDEQVRELTVNALHAAGGPTALDGLLRALGDRREMVRAAAVRFLPDHSGSKDLPALQHALVTSQDEYVREHLMLLIGRIGSAANIPVLQQQKMREKDEHARQAATNALARLGEPQSRQEYMQRLQAEDPQERVRAVEDLLYIQDPKLARELFPLLNDERPAKNVGPSHGPYLLRVCDVVINTLDVVLNHPFPFPVQPVKRYSPNELGQAKTILAQKLG